jgi:hypothetical protein
VVSARGLRRSLPETRPKAAINAVTVMEGEMPNSVSAHHRIFVLADGAHVGLIRSEFVTRCALLLQWFYSQSRMNRVRRGV